jgi:hypothetical protein
MNILELNKTTTLYAIGGLVAVIAIILLTLTQMKNTEREEAHTKRQGDLKMMGAPMRGFKTSNMEDNIKRRKAEARKRG